MTLQPSKSEAPLFHTSKNGSLFIFLCYVVSFVFAVKLSYIISINYELKAFPVVDRIFHLNDYEYLTLYDAAFNID